MSIKLRSRDYRSSFECMSLQDSKYALQKMMDDIEYDIEKVKDQV